MPTRCAYSSVFVHCPINYHSQVGVRIKLRSDKGKQVLISGSNAQSHPTVIRVQLWTWLTHKESAKPSLVITWQHTDTFQTRCNIDFPKYIVRKTHNRRAHAIITLPCVQNKSLSVLLLVISFFPCWATSNLTQAETRGLAYADAW